MFDITKMGGDTEVDPEFITLPIAEWAGIPEGQPRVVQPEFNKEGTTHYACSEGPNPFKPPRD